MLATNDRVIRKALRDLLGKELGRHRKHGCRAEIVEELGVQHGTARIDFAIFNGTIHGYEIKSDCDTLQRLPEQVQEFSTVFDKLTIVVGKSHLYQAMHIVPDWWGVTVAKYNIANRLVLQTIRRPEKNNEQIGLSIARLLWRKEALQILEERNKAEGLRSKPRETIYVKLVDVLDIKTLKRTVSAALISRGNWRPGAQLTSSGG